MPDRDCYFILTTARSGSTSLARILDTATNGVCAIEPMPNLNRETRLAMDGRLSESEIDEIVERDLVPRVARARDEDPARVYGEKNLTYGPFIRAMHERLGCKFVWLRRDGRDVARSMIDWHDKMFGDIYRECADPGQLSARALSAAASLPSYQDTSDYSRPRPTRDDPLFDRWEHLSRLEMCAWSWAKVHEIFADGLSQVPRGSWIELDYTSPSPEDIARVASFLGLEGLDEETVGEMLGGRINSVQDRMGEANGFPRWPAWNEREGEAFDALAGSMMRRLGYSESHAGIGGV